jgi:riboflavin kinase/FMN adenylyltransferase
MVCAMKQYDDFDDIDDGARRGRAVTIGNFDGVHLGHRAVLAHARRAADEQQLELAVLTFEPHPAEFLRPERPNLRLVEPARKVELIEECGADLLLAQRFDERFASLEAGRFAADVLAGALAARLVIVGENFRFGARRGGDIETLREHGARLGFEVLAEHLVNAYDAGISSSRIRQLLVDGDVSRARELLGRCHEVPGTVEHGAGAGAGLGFPTVNLGQVEVLVPGPGIYAAECVVDGAVHGAAAYIGDRPTLGHGATLEAHLFDFDGDLYDARVTLRFIELLRQDQRFDSVDELRQQVGRDIERARRVVERWHG